MVRAYVLIKVDAARTREIQEELRSLPHVESADAVTGPADIIAQIQAEDARSLADLVFSSIQTLDGVRETDTRISVDA